MGQSYICFTIKNTDWGESGYIYLQYPQNTCGLANEATFVEINPSPSHLAEERAEERKRSTGTSYVNGRNPYRKPLGSTCTGPHEFCCEAPGGDPSNCPPSARTSDCDAQGACCCA